MKKIFLIFFVCFWMIVIFCFSNQPAVESTKSSNFVIDFIIDISEKINSKELSIEERQKYYDFFMFPVRKLAHFTIYFILGILVFLLLNELKQSMYISFLFCLIYSLSDEIHQIFVIGRSGKIFDVLIDTFGSVAGIFLMCIIFKRFNSKKKFI